MQFPSEKALSSGTVKPVYRFLKQQVTYFYSTVRQTAVKEFVDCLLKRSDRTVGHSYKAPNAKRARVILTREEANTRLGSFLGDSDVWKFMVDALRAVIKRVGAPEDCIEVSPAAPDQPRPVCLPAHFSLVAFKIHEHFKRVAGVHDAKAGMNTRHRYSGSQCARP